MRKSYLAIAALACSCAATSERFDYSGVDRFWRVAEKLERDEAPSEADWDALFETPGYATMAAHDRSDRTLRAVLPLALMPSRAGEREELAATGDPRGFLVEHLAGAVERREELAAVRATLERQAPFDDVHELAAAWLPESVRGAEAPAISFILLEPDARGYERIVVDLSLAADLGEALVPTIAHEAHHVHRRGLLTYERPEDGSPEADLVAALDNLQAEGVADQIDKTDLLAKQARGETHRNRILALVYARFAEAHARADETLARMDALLVEYGRDPSTAARVGRELRDSLVLGGHPVGFYMATTVLEAEGAATLVEHVGDPFAFVHDYARAAAALGGERHVFSAGALAAVDALRERIGPPGDQR